MVSVAYKRKGRKTIVETLSSGSAQHDVSKHPKVHAEGSLEKLAHDNEFKQSEHVVDTETKHYLPTQPESEASLLREARGAAIMEKVAEKIKIPPALATQHEDQSEIRLTALAHQYDLNAYGRLMHKADGYKAMTVDHSSMSLELALFVLSSRNGPDEAKRMHLLEQAGGTWSWVNSGREESKAKDGTDKEQDLYLTWLGTTFLVGARATLIWKAGMEFRLGLHRKEFEESKATKI